MIPSKQNWNSTLIEPDRNNKTQSPVAFMMRNSYYDVMRTGFVKARALLI